MYQCIAKVDNYVIYHDTIRGNYKIYDGDKIISNPSTIEDAMMRVKLYTNPIEAIRYCEGCDRIYCKECEKYL